MRPVCGGSMVFESEPGRWRCPRCGRLSLPRATDLLPDDLPGRVELMKAGGCRVVIKGPATPSQRIPADRR